MRGQLAARHYIKHFTDRHQRLVLLPLVLEGQLGLGEDEGRVDKVPLDSSSAQGVDLSVVTGLNVQAEKFLDVALLLRVGPELEHVPVLRRQRDFLREHCENELLVIINYIN